MRSKRHLAAAILCLGWALTSWVQIAKYLHGAALPALLLGVAGILVLTLLLEKMRADVAPGWPVFAGLMVIALYFALYPISLRHPFGGGSDGEDALRIGVTALLRGEYPYDQVTYLGNPISPLPGALILAVPFHMRPSLQTPIWIALLVAFLLRWFRLRKTALLFLLAVLLLNPGVLEDIVVGNDYFINSAYLAMAVWLLLRVSPRWKFLAAGLLGIAVCSRVTYAVVLPIVFFALWQQKKQLGIACTAIVLITAASLSLPFYFHDPQRFSPLHVVNKISSGNAVVWVAGFAFAIALSSGWVTLTVERVFGFIGASLSAIFVPATILDALYGAANGNGAMDVLYYNAAPFVFLSLWILKMWETTSPSFLQAKRGPQAAPRVTTSPS